MTLPSRPTFGNRLLDTPERYGIVSRFFHWSIAALLIWQIYTVLAWRLLGPTDFVKFSTALGPGHGTVGVLVLALALVRAVWALASCRRRPAYAKGALGFGARLAHLALYGLMLAIPALALLRAYGSGKGYAFLGAWLLPPTGAKVEWMTAPADLLHAVFAWMLFVLIAGHIGMALVHGFARRDGVLQRMTPVPSSSDAER